jgi:hypothetical protein
MALDSFSNIKAAIKARSKRNDVTDSDLNDYIAQCEAEFYNNSAEPIRIRAMEARATASTSTSSRFLELPVNFLQMRALHIVADSGNKDVTFMAPEQMSVPNVSGIPRYFTVTSQIELDKPSDSVYTIEMQYLRKITGLDDTNTTNEILTQAPNIYLYGGLWALFEDYQEFDVAQYYYQRFIGAIRGLNRTDKNGRYGPAPKMRIEGATP